MSLQSLIKIHFVQKSPQRRLEQRKLEKNEWRTNN